jgi:hypothetical protein
MLPITAGVPARPACRRRLLEASREVVIMDVNSAEQNEPNKIHIKNILKSSPRMQIWHMIIGGVAVLVYLIWMGNNYLGPPKEFENAKTRRDMALSAKVSEQAGPTGDLNKVNPADREAFLSMLAGAPISPRSVLVNVWKSKHKSTQEKMQDSWTGFGKGLHWFP